VSSIIANQVRHDKAFAERLTSRWQYVVVLERLARAAGATRWYCAQSEPELSRVIDELRGGSCVSFYFDDQLRVDLDDEAARQQMFEAVSPAREIVLGYPTEGQIHVDTELVTGPSELSEVLMHHPEGGVVLWGPWPSRTGSSSTVSIDLVDEDGVLRMHPH
jgi:hypothetical protein